MQCYDCCKEVVVGKVSLNNCQTSYVSLIIEVNLHTALMTFNFVVHGDRCHNLNFTRLLVFGTYSNSFLSVQSVCTNTIAYDRNQII